MSDTQPPFPGQPGPPPPNPFGTGAAAQPIPPQQPVPPGVGVAPAGAQGGAAGMAADPSTLAATGLIAAVLFAVGAGLIQFLADPLGSGFRGRLLQLTDTVDVGDVALLGVAVALLLLTPDPPGGIARPILLKIDAALAAVIALYAVIRALAIISQSGQAVLRFGGFVATVGVGIAAATVAFYAAKESFLKPQGRI
jgi:hypothetical protein